MKKALIIFAWISILGSAGDVLIALYGIYLSVFNPSVDLGVSVESLIQHHISFLYWIKQVAYYVLPAGIVVWLFNLPALLYFPIRVLSSVFIGWYALRIASKM